MRLYDKKGEIKRTSNQKSRKSSSLSAQNNSKINANKKIPKKPLLKMSPLFKDYSLKYDYFEDISYLKFIIKKISKSNFSPIVCFNSNYNKVDINNIIASAKILETNSNTLNTSEVEVRIL